MAIKSTNITWQNHTVTRTHREQQNGHKGVTLWFTGLSGSGKSTLANYVAQRLHEREFKTYILDSDNIRHGLNSDLGFSPADRTENIRRITEVAKLFTDAGIIVSVAFISPYREGRGAARKIVGQGDFIEIFVDCSLEECERRDTKGLYKKAREGKIPEFTGISAPYETPEHAEVVVHTDRESIEESGDKIINFMTAGGWLIKNK